MITFEIGSGQLLADGVFIGIGYAGNGSGLNNPLACDEHSVGPLPVGMYTIAAPQDKPLSTGMFSLPLLPAPTNVMYGRSGFFCHGDNAAMNHTASDGCIVAARQVRELIAQHTVLQVVP